MMDYSNISDDKIGAIIVLYNPDIPQLVKSLRVLEQSVGLLCLVDNSKKSYESDFKDFKTVKYIPLMENRGIAAAQNVGVKTLKAIGVEIVSYSLDFDLYGWPVSTFIARVPTPPTFIPIFRNWR